MKNKISKCGKVKQFNEQKNMPPLLNLMVDSMASMCTQDCIHQSICSPGFTAEEEKLNEWKPTICQSDRIQGLMRQWALLSSR